MKTIVLTGMMGSGKTTTGKILATNLNVQFTDIDTLIEKKEKMTISEIFSAKGENYFRNKEYQTIIDNFTPENQIISLGGGAFENKKIQDFLLKNSNVIYLQTSPQTIFNRIKNSINRPLLADDMSVTKIENILNKRDKNYKLAQYSVLTDNKNPEDIVKEIIKCLNLK